MKEIFKEKKFIASARMIFWLMSICLVGVVCSQRVEASGAAEYVKLNKHYYARYEVGMTWSEAKSYCEKLGGHLVTITSEDEQQTVEKLMANAEKNSYWMGGYIEDGTWKWISEEEFSYSNWAYGQPDNYTASGFENVLMMYKNSNAGSECGEWNDLNEDGTCGEQEFFGEKNLGFICEWDRGYKLELEDKLLEFEVGDTGYINYELKKPKKTSKGTYKFVVSKNSKVSFESSNKSVAKVSSKGKVIAKKSGVCKIKLRYKYLVKTVMVVVYPKKVSSLKKQSATAKMAQLKWKALSGVDGYQVWMYDPDLEEYTKVKTTGQTSATVKNLDRGTTYKFKVRAYVKYGKKCYYGPYSKGITVKTKK